MAAEWKWDKTLFGGSAGYYRVGRFPYPAELATAFEEELGLDGSGRLLDVGSGTGQIALLLAPLYDEVVGLDADEDMIAEARAEALRRGHRNTTWVNARAEELPLDLGTFRTATFAQSFHWMDRKRVAATVFEMLEPNGAWVHVHTKTHRGAASEEQLSHPQPPRRSRSWSSATSALRSVLGRERFPAGRRAARARSWSPQGSPGHADACSTPVVSWGVRRTRSSPRSSRCRLPRHIYSVLASRSSSTTCDKSYGVFPPTADSARFRRPSS